MSSVYHLETLVVQFDLRMARFDRQMANATTRLEMLGLTAARLGREMTLFVTTPLALLGAFSIKAAADFESSFTGVRKTVEATEAQFANLEASFRSLAREVPFSVNEINRIAEQAGQLGIGINSIEAFTKVMLDLGATTNLTAENAADSLARFATVMQMPQDDFDRLGSAIVDLGNKFATTEAEIVTMAQRIAGIGNLVNLSAAQVLGFANAISATGIKAEFGGTAITRIFKQMDLAARQGGANLETFANTAGMTADQFATAFKEDAGAAMVAFTEGLHRAQEESGNMNDILGQLKLNSVRVSDTLIRLAESGNLLSKSLKVSEDAFQKNQALLIEAEKRYNTFSSQVGMLRNELYDFAIDLGRALIPTIKYLIGVTKEWAESWRGLSDTTKGTIAAIGTLTTAIGPLVYFLGPVTTRALIPMGAAFLHLNRLMGRFGMATVLVRAPLLALAGTGGVIALFTAGVYLLSKAIYALNPAVRSFNEQMQRAERLNALWAIRMEAARRTVVDFIRTLKDAERIDAVREAMGKTSAEIRTLEARLKTAKDRVKELQDSWVTWLHKFELEEQSQNVKMFAGELGKAETQLDKLARMGDESTMQDMLKEAERRLEFLGGEAGRATVALSEVQKAVDKVIERAPHEIPGLSEWKDAGVEWVAGLDAAREAAEGANTAYEEQKKVINAVKLSIEEMNAPYQRAIISFDEAKKAIGLFTDEQEFLRDTIGLTAGQAKLYETAFAEGLTVQQMFEEEAYAVALALLAENEAFKEGEKVIDDVVKVYRSLEDSARDYADSVADEITTHEMGRGAAAAYAFEMDGLEGAELAAAQAAGKAIDAFDEEQRAIDRVKQIVEDTHTPLEELWDIQNELMDLAELGAFDEQPEAFKRAWEAAVADFDKHKAKIEEPIRITVEGWEDLDKDSAEFLRRGEAMKAMVRKALLGAGEQPTLATEGGSLPRDLPPGLGVPHSVPPAMRNMTGPHPPGLPPGMPEPVVPRGFGWGTSDFGSTKPSGDVLDILKQIATNTKDNIQFSPAGLKTA